LKFLCEHCKAKYQIADDKVAGRTVRMKCRKCGNPIEVRAAVTETSTSSRAPKDPLQQTSVGQPSRQSVPPPKAQTGGASAAPKPGGLATSLSSTARPTRPPGAGPRSQDVGAPGMSYLQRGAPAQDDHSAGLDLRELSAADEWYVAINGVPVGPVRVAELRRKAALSVVTEDSLCWQEGMEEWRPVRAVTELAAVVREAAAGGRVSLMTSPAPPEGRPSSPPPRPAPPPRAASQPTPSRAPTAPVTAAAPMAPAAPAVRPTSPSFAHQPQPQQAVARSNVVPFSSANRLATAERLEPEPAAPAMSPMISPDPFALPSPAPGPTQASPFVAPATAAAVAPLGVPVASVASGVLPPIVSPEAQRRPVPWILLAMFVLAGAFGVTAALLVFKQQPPQVVVVPQQVAVPAAPPTVAPPPTADIPSAAPVDSSAAAAPAADAGSAKPAAVAVRNPSSGTRPTTTTTATDPSLQDLIRQTGSGPISGPAAPVVAAGGGGGQMTEGQIMAVVMQHQQGVKRTCWERSSGTTPSANVSVQISVSPTGAVQSAQATGNDPVVTHCIENEVRGWKFPMGSSVPIVIPFHFVRQ
jgi:predicted Zn finger-like uncharacterized protein